MRRAERRAIFAEFKQLKYPGNVPPGPTTPPPQTGKARRRARSSARFRKPVLRRSLIRKRQFAIRLTTIMTQALYDFRMGSGLPRLVPADGPTAREVLSRQLATTPC